MSLLKRVVVLFLISFIVGIGATTVFAQDLHSFVSDAKKVYDSFKKEAGGIVIAQKTKITTPQGEMFSNSKIYREGDLFRIDTETTMPQLKQNMGPFKTVVLFDGKDAWMFSTIMGKKQLTKEESDAYRSDMNWWDLLNDDAKITSEEKVQGRACYVIEFTNVNKSMIWVDKTKFVLVKGETVLPNNEKMFWEHSDFKTIDSKWDVPYVTKMFTKDLEVSSSEVISIETKQNFSDELFNAKEIDLQVAPMEFEDVVE